MRPPAPQLDHNRQRAFTLLEMLVVIMIIALMMTIAGVNMSNRGSRDLQTIGRTLVSDLRYIRSRAMIGNADTSVTIDVAEKIYFSDNRSIERQLDEQIKVELLVDERDVNGTRGTIYFYPDGSSSGGEINLQQGRQAIDIVTTWLNGHVSLHNRL